MMEMNKLLSFCISYIILALIHVTHTEVLNDNENIDSLDKRAPGWGKGSVQNILDFLKTDLSRFDINKDNLAMALVKRIPGWGKRNFEEEFELSKRKPGWGKRSSVHIPSIKRAPGWGKRDSDSKTNLAEEERLKRRPGWGKRSYDDWGFSKRQPGWGKRSPGWGKRSNTGNQQMCQETAETIRLLQLKLEQVNTL